MTVPGSEPGPNLEQLDRLAKLGTRQANAAESPLKKRTHFWVRWLHVYTSLISLVLVIFFGLTGITLNHPDWTLGQEASLSTVRGDLPDEAISDAGEVEFLVISEFVRAEHEVRGQVTNFGVTDGQGTISYKAPGYGAEVFFDVELETYTLTSQRQGFLAIMNDLHKGRDTRSSWRWLIDVSGALLVIVGLTGLGIQLFMRKRRFSGLSLAAIGSVVTVALIWLALQ